MAVALFSCDNASHMCTMSAVWLAVAITADRQDIVVQVAVIALYPIVDHSYNDSSCVRPPIP